MNKQYIGAALTAIISLSAIAAQQTSAQGIRINGGSVRISPQAAIACQGSLNNEAGLVTNNGSLGISDSLVNSGTIGGDGLCTVGGDWINRGTFDRGSGIVIFSGTAPQSIAAPYLTIFNDLVISAASAGTTIEPGAMVTVAGSVFNTNGKLTVSSSGPDNSGSLIYSGTGMPAGDIIYIRSMPSGTYYSYVSSPVAGTVLPVTAQFWAWDEPSGDWGDPVVASSGATGYTVRTNGQPLVFTGPLVTSFNKTATSPYTTDYSSGTLAEYNSRIARNPFGGGGWNLLGNPFTSAMTVGGPGGFLDANDGDGTMATNSFDPNYVAVYIYDGDSYYYRGKDVFFPDPEEGEVPGNVMFGFDNVQAGQGFFVLAMKEGVAFHFDNAMQIHATGTDFLKSANEEEYWPGLCLKARCGEDENRTMVVFNEEMTAGLDPGYDVGLLSSGGGTEIYTSLAARDNGINFTRQALPVTGADQAVIPVGVDSGKGGDITFEAFVLPLGENRFWLEDRAKGIFTDLGTKSYTTTLSPDTYGTGRFFIIASANTPTGIGEQEETGDGLRIWVSGDRVVIRGSVGEGSVCELFDMGGRKMKEQRLSGGEMNFVNLPEKLNGVIVVRVTDGEKVVTRKVVVA